jgi:DNA-binding winged helix-turn-helix (wHTH) protein
MWNETVEFLADIDGFPILMRFLLQDAPVGTQSGFVSSETDIHSLLSNMLDKMIDRMRESYLRRGHPSKRSHAIVELVIGEASIQSPSSNETMLHVGTLELDLIDRTVKRDGRPIELRPREFRLLKYMMQRSDQLLTRATLLKEVWQYKFVPETNLVDVHMGRLRRKVDGSNDVPMIRNVRGVGFVLSATPFLRDSPAGPTERSTSRPSQPLPEVPSEDHSNAGARRAVDLTVG